MTKRMFLMLFAAMLAISADGQGFAQQQRKGQRQIDSKNVLGAQVISTLAPQRCFSSGTGATFLKICITNNGNISWFESPAGWVHLQYREGYAVCSSGNGSGVVHGFDANVAAGGWLVSTVSQPNGIGTLPLIITRQSLDGVIQLKQTFTINAGERGLDLKLDIKNISATPLVYVWVNRYFDADVDNNSKNEWERTGDSVWGKNPADLARGLMLTAAPSSTLSTFTSVTDYKMWDPNNTSGQQYARGCSYGNWGPFLGDAVGNVVTYLPGLVAGQTKSVTLRYRRF
jgi:hypothetical protein